MRDVQRTRIMERMRKKGKERGRRMTEEMQHKSQNKKDLINGYIIEKMAFVALNPLHLTIFCLVDSVRVSIDPRGRDFLIFAFHGVNEAVELLKSLGKLRDRIESERMEALEGVINEAARRLENVLDFHVSAQFLSQSGDEGQPLLFSLNLQGIENDIDGFIQTVIKMEKLVNPWLVEEEEHDDDDGGRKESDLFGLSSQSDEEITKTLFRSWFPEEDSDPMGDGGGKESDILGLSEVDVSRSWFISWFATKAASIFSGIKEEYINDLENLLPQEEEDDDYVVLFTTDFSIMVSEERFCKIKGDLMIWWINKVVASIFVMEKEVKPLPEYNDVVVASSGTESAINMVGSTDLFFMIRDGLLEDFEERQIVSIVGMAGIGKTVIAKKFIQDPLILSKFECCIFVRMGPESEWRETILAIVAQIPKSDKILMEEGVDLNYYVCETIKVRKCLLVLDDCWNLDQQFTFDISIMGSSKSVILFTTRIGEGARKFHFLAPETIYTVPFLNKEESWDLLCDKIFGEKRCPRELEKDGKKIAENCEGLPLLILAVAGLLSLAEKTSKYWREVAGNKTNSIFVDAYEQVSGVAYPSYKYLPQHLKACFLYMGAFPQNDEFRVSRLNNLWSVDGFLCVAYIFLQEHGYKFLKEIVSNNVAMGTQWSADYPHRVKSLSLHSVFWYLCKIEARNEKFLHVLNSYTDASVLGIESQTRLSIYKNVLFSIKHVRDSIASISAVRSLLCTGPYHQYEVPICLGKLRLLKVLDALTIRFYEFPIEVVKLVQLRYLALTCNGNLRPSISNLWGLQSLILHQHQSIKSFTSETYLPVEIWDLLQLEHLQIAGRNLPDPPHDEAKLENLLVLLDAGALSCSERVLARIPNLKKLRVQIELLPVSAEPLRFCDDISHLESLESLQFIVVNPELEFFEICGLPTFVSFSNIRKLTLSGYGYPWKDMRNVAALPCLEVLKLKCYAFQGEKWQVEGEFWRLTYLSIEDSDLVEWTGKFSGLYFLTIKNCYRLLELPELSSWNLREIRVVDCNPSAVTCAKKMESKNCRVSVDSSWLGDGKRS